MRLKLHHNLDAKSVLKATADLNFLPQKSAARPAGLWEVCSSIQVGRQRRHRGKGQ